MRSSICFRTNNEDGPGHDKWVRLRTLESLFAEGFITQAELKERRLRLIDELTGCTVSTNSSTPDSVSLSAPQDTQKSPQLGLTRHRECCPKLKPKPGMPNFDYTSRKWSHTPITVQIDVAPFARGALRMVYHM